MFFYLFALVMSAFSPALAADKVLAIVIGPESYTQNDLFRAAFNKQLGDVNAAVKAKSVAEALKNRVDKVELLTSPAETTKSNLEARLNALPYEGQFDEVMLFWFGWSYNGFTYQMGTTTLSSKDTFIPCSDLSLDVETVDFSLMKESSFSPEELSLLLIKIAPRRSVILDVNRAAWIYAEGDLVYRFRPGLTAEDWPKDDAAVAMSAPPGGAASDLALYVMSVLSTHEGALTYLDFLAAITRASVERGEIMTVPVVYGALTHDADMFLGPVRPELAVQNPYATPPLPTNPLTVQKTGNKKAAWWGALGVAGLCAAGGTAEMVHFATVRETVKNNPASYASYEDYLAAIKSANASLGTAGVLGGCAVLGGSVGTLGLALKW